MPPGTHPKPLLVPPPMRIVRKGWLGPKELSFAEAEAYHLREAAKKIGKAEQMLHLDEAHRNRVAARRLGEI
jgi:hypothetical protein